MLFSNRWSTLLMMTVLLLLFACSGTEKKREAFYTRGETFYEQGDFARARIEFTNSVRNDSGFAQGYYMLGMAQLKLKRHREAFGAFQKAAALKPDLWDAQLQLGHLYFMSGDHAKAMAQAVLLLERNPRDPDALLLKATLLLADRQVKPAIQLLEKIQATGWRHPELYLILTSAYVEAKRTEQAERILTEGIAVFPGQIPLYLKLSNLFMEQERYADTEALLLKIIALAPGNHQYKANLANFYWMRGRRRDADAIIAQILAADPENERARLETARFYIRHNAFAKAQGLLEDGVKRHPESVKLRLLLGDVYLAMNDAEKTVQTVQKCLTPGKDLPKPETILAHNALAEAHLVLGDLQQAEQHIRQVQSIHAGDVGARFLLGRLYLSRGAGDHAIAQFRSVLNDRPGFVAAYLGLAEAHRTNNDLDLGLDALRTALKSNPDHVKLHQTLAQFYDIKGDMAAAEQHLRKAVQIAPKAIPVRLELGDLLLQRKDLDAAEQVFLSITRQFPEHPSAWIRLSRIYNQKKEPAKAAAVLKSALDANPDAQPLVMALALTYNQANRPTDAIALCDAFVTRKGPNPLVYNMIGLSHMVADAPGQAKGMFEKALTIDPLFSPAHDNLARLYLRQKNKDAIIRNLRETIAKQPKHVSIYLTLARILEIEQDFSQAISVYRRVLEQEPSLWVAANNMAFLMTEHRPDHDDLLQALDLAKRVVSMRPTDPAAMDTLGWAHYHLGQYHEALRAIEQALARQPGNITIRFHWGMALYKTGRLIEARRSLEKVLANDVEFLGRSDGESVLRQLS